MLITLLERVFNRILRLDRESLRRLGELQGKVVCIQLGQVGDAETPLEVYALPSNAGLRLMAHCDAKPDVTLRGTFPVILELVRGEARPDLFSSGELEVSGDIELGRYIHGIIKDLEIDWEEQASRVIGDVAAHKLGNLLRDARAWRAQSLRSLGVDVAEYLQEESRTLAARTRVDVFLSAVDELRADTDRLEARLRRLRELV